MTNEKAWDFAIGLAQIDGVKPLKNFQSLLKRKKEGK